MGQLLMFRILAICLVCCGWFTASSSVEIEKVEGKAGTHDTALLEIDPRLQEVLEPWDRIRLTAESCQEGPTYARAQPPNMDFITDAEQCHTCSQIVHNMNRWNWQKHYSSLCVNVPRHLLGLVS